MLNAIPPVCSLVMWVVILMLNGAGVVEPDLFKD